MVFGNRNREWCTLRTATAALVLGGAIVASPAAAAFLSGSNGDDVIFGADDDNVDNPVIQPAGAVNQSLNNADAIDGRAGDDVLIGLGGSDTIRGGPGDDVIVGGTEQFIQPNSDIMFGDDGDDVSLWRGGDGSDAFIGGRGTDALVFGNVDRDVDNIPIISAATGRHRKTGLPTADVTSQGGFCTLEDVRGQGLGYDFLVRFFVRATGNLAVTVRTADVEQVFCTSETARAITFADLTSPYPAFQEVSLEDVGGLNPLVRQIIR
jgi:Ca2+-binding RTX toxin-like protein